MFKLRIPFVYLVLVIILGTSCRSTRQFVYFRDQKDSTFVSGYGAPVGIIQENDILSVIVSSQNAEASAVFNTPNNSTIAFQSSAGTMNQISGYLVSRDGYIVLPMIGKIKAAGSTKTQLEDAVTKLIASKKILVDPVVNIRILTFKVTVLGEVEKPGVLSVPNEKISLLEALGLAGDLTIHAQRDNILLIREEGGKKLTKRINLNSSELFNSPYYYLKSNDVVYVEPNKIKVRSNSNANIWVPIIFSALSFLIIAVQYKVI